MSYPSLNLLLFHSNGSSPLTLRGARLSPIKTEQNHPISSTLTAKPLERLKHSVFTSSLTNYSATFVHHIPDTLV